MLGILEPLVPDQESLELVQLEAVLTKIECVLCWPIINRPLLSHNLLLEVTTNKQPLFYLLD